MNSSCSGSMFGNPGIRSEAIEASGLILGSLRLMQALVLLVEPRDWAYLVFVLDLIRE